MQKNVKTTVAKGMKTVLDTVLKTEFIMFQPKAPEELMKYRRSK